MTKHVRRAAGPVALLLAILAVAAPAQAAGERSLQDRIDAHIDRYGGKQVGSNQIVWDDGVRLTMRDRRPRASSAAFWFCPPGYVCVYSDANFRGHRFDFYYCRVYRLPEYGFRTYTYSGASSFKNAQTGGAKVVFRDEWHQFPPLVYPTGQWNLPGFMNDKAYWLQPC